MNIEQQGTEPFGGKMFMTILFTGNCLITSSHTDIIFLNRIAISTKVTE